MWPEQPNVSLVITEKKDYPRQVPFHPPELYPEYTGTETDPDNQVYAGVREVFHRLGLDQEHFGTPEWNPLGEFVKPGMMVLVKPNLVRDRHIAGGDVISVLTHASVIRPILDYVSIALKGEGRIIVGDTQVIDAIFDKTLAVSQIDALIDWYTPQASVPVECHDFRTHHSAKVMGVGDWGRAELMGDPRGYAFVDVGEQSTYVGIPPETLRIAIAPPKNMYKHHSNGHHEYRFPKTVLASDVIIGVPKMKTHRRTGITLALKIFMGLPGWKDTLAHFRLGSPEEGGDQYIHPSLRKRIYTKVQDWMWNTPIAPLKVFYAAVRKAIMRTKVIKPYKDTLIEGKWYGNDTVWRTLLDIHRAAVYADKDGNLCQEPQRKLFFVLDGIIGGEKSGPTQPDPFPAGVLMAGHNPAALDAATATLLGFDIDRIPLIAKALEKSDTIQEAPGYTRSHLTVTDSEGIWTLDEFAQRYNLHFEPHPHWKGHIERGI
jgi:uncharacterized protein (DUF362 family)